MATPDDLVHCPICLELYIQPRALPCLHTFCDTCLQEYIDAAARNASIAYGFECPICRQHAPPPSPAISGHSGWSKLFPHNHIVATLLDARNSKPANTNGDKSTGNAPDTSGSSWRENTLPDTQPVQGTSDNITSNMQDFAHDSASQAQNRNFNTEDDSSYKGTDQEHWPHSYPPPHGQPCGPPPHHFHPHGPPPPHHFGPAHHPGPPYHPGPPHPHWPPPPHHRPHHRGRGCHGPHGEPRGGHHPRGPRGRFPHSHGPRRHHHSPPY